MPCCPTDGTCWSRVKTVYGVLQHGLKRPNDHTASERQVVTVPVQWPSASQVMWVFGLQDDPNPNRKCQVYCKAWFFSVFSKMYGGEVSYVPAVICMGVPSGDGVALLTSILA
jgi:hypothetical protein